MNLKNIVLYRATADNAGTFQDAGATLRVSDDVEEGAITLARATDLIDDLGAASATAAAAAEAQPPVEAAEPLDLVEPVPTGN